MVDYKFVITDEFPYPILKDFNTFVTYIVKNRVPVSTRSNLPYEHLYRLNQLMTMPRKGILPRTHQSFYPHLNLFYEICFAKGLLEIAQEGSKPIFQGTELLQEYNKLTPTEKYFSLLETLWVHCNLKVLAPITERNPRGARAMSDLIKMIAKIKPGAKRTAYSSCIKIMIYRGFLPLYLFYFGLFDATFADPEDKTSEVLFDKGSSYIISMRATEFGAAMVSILHKHRNIMQWNIPHIKLERCEPYHPPREPFFLAFVHLFKEGELKKTLPERKRKIIKGNYIFRVSLHGGASRKIAISGNDTLVDLHYAIQSAFNFDCDHSYAFFMDGRAWSSRMVFWAPECEDRPSADGVSIAELGLTKGREFLYLFDFGHEWRFKVRLVDIDTESPELKEYKILEVKGEAPKQYPDYE